MTEVSTSIEISASADKVWAIIGGFDNLPQWLNLIRTSTLEDGGRVRRLEAVGGALIVERLLSFDEAERRFSYSHLEAPDPVTDYVSEMRVSPLDEGRCTVVWACRFTPVSVSEAEAIAHFDGIYSVGLHALKALVEG
ncbi:SRPBCC family protein [Novosphingobium sp. PP1Y]|uniref:SRPBCC family protein n=1 Tax=Novosphingobium sp. PP1Y TaxID=702113 RepID=UPI00020EFB95|nr:SRPBCC family protein [Novosphingobium sp. PP1Y]CCA90741.1 conserved hypothetical protein [Novosphingobium sp. PP1Y]